MTAASDATVAPARRWVVWLRGIVFVALLLQIWGGPFARQVAGVRHRALRQWTMFSLKGVGLFAVEYTLRAPDGTETPIDRYALMGLAGRHEAGKTFRRIKSRRGAFTVARQLCSKLRRREVDPIDKPDVRIYARRSTRYGWKPTDRGELNACVGKLPEREPKKKRKKRRETNNGEPRP